MDIIEELFDYLNLGAFVVFYGAVLIICSPFIIIGFIVQKLFGGPR